MNRNNNGGTGISGNNWAFALSCGHEIFVPWDAPVPLMMSCAIRHQLSCGEASEGWVPGDSRGPPIPMEKGARR